MSNVDQEFHAMMSALSDISPDKPDLETSAASLGRRRSTPLLVTVSVFIVVLVVGTLISVITAPKSIAEIVAASWTPIPSQAEPGLVEAAELVCGADKHRTYSGTLPLAVIDQRGDAAVAVFAAFDSEGSYGRTCNLVRINSEWVSGGDVDFAMDGGNLTGTISQEGVVGVLLERPDGTMITASVGGGVYLFWFVEPPPWDSTIVLLDADGIVISREPLLSPGEEPPPSSLLEN